VPNARETSLLSPLHLLHTQSGRIDLDQCRRKRAPAACVRCGAIEAERKMNIEVSDLIVGLMMAGFGLLGLILASGAVDDEMYLFGVALFGFACVFILGLVRVHYDRLDAARATAKAGGRRHV
jgi:hypothetical protein